MITKEEFLGEFEDIQFPLLGLVKLPQVEIELKYKDELNLPKNCSNYEFLCALAKKGLQESINKLPKERLNEYFERADYELSIFEELGFTDYVLLVWLVINKVKESGAFCDFGRGSIAGSFIFALLGITGILDVIDKGLFFERFVSRTRSKKQIVNGETYLVGDYLPDADLNLGGVREEIVEWLKGMYKGKICKISALSTLTGKILIKDVYKTVNDVDEYEAKRVADLVEKHFGIVEDLSKMPEKSKDFKEWTEKFPETFNICLSLRNLIRQRTSHASGYFISYYDLDGFIPLELNRDKELTMSYEMTAASKFGIKLDLLGLVQNEILTEFFKEIPEKVDEIELDKNPIVYNQFQNESFLPYGLYQISASCTYKVVQKVKPKNIFELSDCNAISRPGALDYLDDYTSNEAKSPHPIFDNIVKLSRNLFLYQENLMQALVAIGFTLDESEMCRKIVGKKLVKEVKEWEGKIYQRVKENNLPQEIGPILWKVLLDSSKYSFNKSHSLSTSKLTALTVWAKYQYPLQFYKACLNSAKKLPNCIEEISLIEKELSHFNIKLLPPDIIKSGRNFVLEDGNIRYALSAFKGVSDKVIERLDRFRHPYSNKFELFQSAKEAKLPINILSTLLAAGVLDGNFTQSRSWVILEAQTWNILTDRERRLASNLGKEYNFDLLKIVPKMKELKEENGKPMINSSRWETIYKKYLPYKEIYKQNSKCQEFADWYFSKKYTGFTYSKSLKDIFIQKRPGLLNSTEIRDTPDGERNVAMVGQIVEVKKGISRNKNPYVRFVVSDEANYCTVFLFNDKIKQCEELNGENLPEKEDFVIVRGMKKGTDAIFAEIVAIQDNEVSMKINKNIEKLPKDEDFAPKSNILFPILKNSQDEEDFVF